MPPWRQRFRRRLLHPRPGEPPGGEKGLERTLGHKRTEYVKKRVKKSAGWALALASLMPPPFPFSPFVAGAAAFQYPRKKLLSVIAASRFVRFSIDGC